MPLLRNPLLLAKPAGISLWCGQSSVARTCLYGENLSTEQRYVEIPTAHKCPEMHSLTVHRTAHLRLGVLRFSGPLSLLSSPQKTLPQAHPFLKTSLFNQMLRSCVSLDPLCQRHSSSCQRSILVSSILSYPLQASTTW